MLGTKTIGRSVVFGLGYLAGTRAGRERYDQLQQVGRQLATQLREQLQNAPDNSPRRSPARPGGPGTTATSGSGSPEDAVRIRIHLVARLLKVPILRIDGDIRLQDDDDVPGAGADVAGTAGGPLLASAEADLEGLDRSRRNARPAVRRRAG